MQARKINCITQYFRGITLWSKGSRPCDSKLAIVGCAAGVPLCTVYPVTLAPPGEWQWKNWQRSDARVVRKRLCPLWRSLLNNICFCYSTTSYRILIQENIPWLADRWLFSYNHAYMYKVCHAEDAINIHDYVAAKATYIRLLLGQKGGFSALAP